MATVHGTVTVQDGTVYRGQNSANAVQNGTHPFRGVPLYRGDAADSVRQACRKVIHRGISKMRKDAGLGDLGVESAAGNFSEAT